MSPKQQQICVLIFYFFLDIFFFVQASKSFAEDITYASVECNQASSNCLMRRKSLIKNEVETLPLNYHSHLKLEYEDNVCNFLPLPLICQNTHNLYLLDSGKKKFITKIFKKPINYQNILIDTIQQLSFNTDCINLKINNHRRELYGYLYLFLGFLVLAKAINSVFGSFSDLDENSTFTISGEFLPFLLICILAVGTMFFIASSNTSRIEITPCSYINR